jgi:hypothetical protein
MTVFMTEESFEGTPAELFELGANTELLAAWDQAIVRIEESERAAAAEDSVTCGGHCTH